MVPWSEKQLACCVTVLFILKSELRRLAANAVVDKRCDCISQYCPSNGPVMHTARSSSPCHLSDLPIV